MSPADPPVVIIGGGHNGLVAATYLARAGRRVTVLEGRSTLGGAVASSAIFSGVAARLSRFSYLVSLLPQLIIDDLGLSLELRSRRVKAYTPVGGSGLLIERPEGPRTRESFVDLTGEPSEFESWMSLEDDLGSFAAVVAPTLTEPLPRADDLRRRVPDDLWTSLVERPIGELLEAQFSHDVVRGVALTDALIGTFTTAHDPTLRQNRCFLYHVIGNSTGEWRVPVGGMGAVAAELTRAALEAGAELRTGAEATSLRCLPAGGAQLTLADGESIDSELVLVNCAPATLQRLLGEPYADPVGCQTKINIVVRRLPRFASGIDPQTGFAGTLHLRQGYHELQAAYEIAEAGQIPDPMPCEVYCHTLTDLSILSPELQSAGYHTLTVFGLHTPAELFRDDPDGARDRAGEAALRALQAVLAEPLEDCLALDADGRPCVEVMSPLDIEAAIGMPGGHIFHGDLAWPWLSDSAVPTTAAERWGVATAHPGILLCGSGAVRGGAVSGIGGHNAAMAVLDG